jgi:SAM-dependent methyltransferase
MKDELRRLLRCPDCSGSLELQAGTSDGDDVLEGTLRCPAGHAWPIVRGIPRFVPPENYAGSFGRQWNKFRGEQLDSFTGSTLSLDRFRDVTRWSPEDLAGRWVLDAGCGAGRFAEIALQLGANVVALDLSSAVEACRENLARRYPGRLHVVQGDIFRLPFAQGSFDLGYSIGVLQHTPDPLRALDSVARAVRPGGELAVWIYELTWKSFLGINAWKYGLRPLTRLLPHGLVEALSWGACAILAPLWFPFIYLGAAGRFVLSWYPVAARPYVGMGLRPGACFRCVVLDTVDMYTPAYDRPQRYGPARRVLEAAGYGEIRRTCTGLGLRAARGRAP